MRYVHPFEYQSNVQYYLNTDVWKLTGAEQLPHAQVADDQPHDGGFVQVGGDIVWQGELLC